MTITSVDEFEVVCMSVGFPLASQLPTGLLFLRVGSG